MPKLFPLIFIGVFLPVLSIAQQSTAFVPIAETESFRIEEFTWPGEACDNKVNDIVQGPNGFLWFASHCGLFRFDGHEMISYTALEQESLENDTANVLINVAKLVWDRYDQLWVCTVGNGLYRFNPETEKFLVYNHDPNDPNSLSSDFVWCAAEDKEGDLWVGTFKGLNRFDRKTERFEHFRSDSLQPGTISNDLITKIYLDKQGSLWIASGYPGRTELPGFNRYDPKTNSFISYAHPSMDPSITWTNDVRGMLEDSRGNFWIATRGAGLQKMDREKGNFERMHYHPSKPHAPGAEDIELPGAYSLLEDKHGALWIGNLSGSEYPYNLLRYDPFTSTVDTLPVNSSAWHLYESSDGSIWVAGSDEPNGKKVLKITAKEKKIDLQQGAFMFAAFKDADLYDELNVTRSEDRWLGPSSMTFDPKNGSIWLRYIYEVLKGDGHKSYPILANHNKHTGETQFYHLKELNLRSLNDAVYKGNPSIGWFAAGMAVAKDGKVWGSYPSDSVGVFCFDPATGFTVNYRHIPNDSTSLMSNYVVAVFMDSRGDVWAGQYEKGLSWLNPSTGIWTHYPLDPQGYLVGAKTAVAIIEGEDGKIWIAGSTNKFQPFIRAIDPISKTIQDLTFSRQLSGGVRFLAQIKEKIYFGSSSTTHGVGVLSLDKPNDPLFVYSSRETNFPIENIAAGLFDKEGNLWITSSTNATIVKLDPERQQWISFSSKDGEQPLSRNGVSGPEGNIFFPTFNAGWLEIDPDEIRLPPVESLQLRLVDLLVLGKRQIAGKSKILPKPVWQLNTLNLPYQTRNFGFRFSTFDFRSPRVVYHYRLYPYESDWQILNGDPEVHYSYVPAGTYQFQVKTYTMYGLQDQEGINLTVVLHPPWWKTWWAYTSYVLVLMALIAGLLLYQRRRLQLQARLQLERERADRLKELDQFKSRFYTNITHEFRTPLTVIKGMADQISGQEKVKTLILRNSERLLNMVNQLLDLSRLENNSLTIDWVQGNVIPYLRYLTESCHSLANDKHLHLAFFAREESLVMDYDENKLQQILINLLSNAIKFTPVYGSVKVTAARVFKEDQPFLELIVRDSGKGIPPEKLPHIFDRFYQIDDSETRQGEGSGVGLALVSELVQLLDGQITVNSEEGKGTRFVVHLPIHQQAAKAESLDLAAFPLTQVATDGQESQTTAGPDEKPQVLIIEDNADVIEYIFSCLKPDYKLYAARDGREGLQKALEQIPDVILCDVMMPEMDGFEVCRRLKADQRSSHIPIILLTAKATREDKITGLSQGADAYLTKPFDKQELSIRLRNLIAQSQRLRERLSDPDTNDQPTETEQREAAFLQEVNKVIESNLNNDLFNTHYLCRAMTMSRAQLYRKLKALTGQSTAHYIRRVRLKKAKSLLETSNLTIGEIALQVGYKDFSHFSRSFLKEFDLSPSEIRK